MREAWQHWSELRVPEIERLPASIFVRAERLPARHAFPEHRHDWNQLVHAISGVLVVAADDRWFAVPPRQAVWIPTGTPHRVGTWLGAEFRSLYVADRPRLGMPSGCRVLDVSDLLRALIVEAERLSGQTDDPGYASRVRRLTLDQLRRMPAVRFHLPWPRSPMLDALCQALYAHPADKRSIEEWGARLGASPRTLSRRFIRETGLSPRAWRHRLRLFRAIELLGAGRSVTATALELGYASTSAFSYMFRSEMAVSPGIWSRHEAVS